MIQIAILLVTINMRAINMQDQVLANLGLRCDRLIPIIRSRQQVQLSLFDLENLIQEIAQSKSKHAFKKLFDFYYPKAMSYLMKAGLSKEVSAELSQEAMLKVWKKSSLYSPELANVNTWLFTILRNTKYDYLRKQSRDPLAIIGAENVFDENLHSTELEEDVESIYLRAQTQEMITRLSQEQQEVLYGIYREGLTQTEYAKLNELPLGTVKSRVRLAIKNLKILMEEK